MTEYAASGDHRRSMELLWGVAPAPARGPKPGLSVDAIVAAATAIADAEGLGALSMRKVGERLGVSAMALYSYVPGKRELLDVMLDRAYGEQLPRAQDGGWREQLERAARVQWALYERHPWILHVAAGRAALGPNELDSYESSLRIVDGIGLTGVEMMRVVGAVQEFVGGCAKAVSDALAAERVTGVTDDEWWEARYPLLEEVANVSWHERFPVSARLGEEGAFEQRDREPDDDSPYLVREALDVFEFGLQRLLDGIEAFVRTRGG